MKPISPITGCWLTNLTVVESDEGKPGSIYNIPMIWMGNQNQEVASKEILNSAQEICDNHLGESFDLYTCDVTILPITPQAIGAMAKKFLNMNNLNFMGVSAESSSLYVIPNKPKS